MSKSADNLNIVRKARAYFELFDFHKGQTRDFARHDYEVYTDVIKAAAGYLNTDKKLPIRVLDLGCGQRYPNALLFANGENREVFAADTDIVGPGIFKYFKMIRRNGMERSVKSALREFLFDRSYYKALSECSGRTLDKSRLTIVNADARRLPLENNFFDLVVSNAVFEHIEDIPGTLEELRRVSKPGAIYYIVIHLYCSLSGGHNMRWAFPDRFVPGDVPPWDHLRENRFPSHIYVNGLREAEYREIFRRYMEILEWNDGLFEGEELLSPEIERELSGYSREELLKRYVTVLCRPKY